MKALITGASTGLGKEFAVILSQLGYDLVLVARRKNLLDNLKKQIKTDVKIISLDLSIEQNCIDLYNSVKDDDLDIIINNAGFGLFGPFDETSLEKELNMVDLNIKSVHILTKLFLKDFIKKDSGYILNVASSAAFQPGPLMATYYATKSYVFNLTQGINGELKKNKSNVYIGALCPGPVKTEFNRVANVKFSFKALEANNVCNYAIREMFKRKTVIIPGFTIKLAYYFGKIVPLKLKLHIAYNIQRKKEK